MTKYYSIVLTEDKRFCIAPTWGIEAGDLITISGCDKPLKVIATATDSEDGDFIKMVQALTVTPLPKVEKRFRAYEVDWED